MLDIFPFINEKVFGSSIPSTEEDIDSIIAKGIDVIISFELPLIPFENSKLEHIPFPIKDFSIPSEKQVTEFLSIVRERLNQNKKILVHCYAGCGRTGIMLTIIALGLFQKDLDSVLQHLRTIRPCSEEIIKNPVQYRFLKKYAAKKSNR